jgi:poly-gamma-glutamate synthesis protein (capsule biosynthesis protein)
MVPELDEWGLRRIEAAVAPHRRTGDLTLVSLHWGGNWVERIPEAHRRFARALIDRDLADVVHGHSSHHPLPVEVHGGKAILYGCGDLINDYEGIGDPWGRPSGLRSDLGCLYLVELRRCGGRLERLEVVPFRLRRFRLTHPDPSDQEAVERMLGLPAEGWRRTTAGHAEAAGWGWSA